MTTTTTNTTMADRYDELTREQLLAMLRERDAHAKQVAVEVEASTGAKSTGKAEAKATAKAAATSFPAPKKPKRAFDFSRHSQRRIALKFMYLGWNYDGLAYQDNSDNTVEHHLFAALEKCRLIRDRHSCGFDRCGRTDKGVSAFSQVVALNARSNMPPGHPGTLAVDDGGDAEVKVQSDEAAKSNFSDDADELPYIQMLNSILPPNIRIFQWSPVAPTFSARFDCRTRTYKYFFPRAQLDVEAMGRAAAYLVGEHDFRNFCKFDAGKGIVSYERTVLHASIDQWTASSDVDRAEETKSGETCADVNNAIPPHRMMAFTISGTAFLWHQVRCIMGILFLVGEGKEYPHVVHRMLDVKAFPVKPGYVMASDLPLVLWDCAYNSDAVHFRGTQRQHLHVQQVLIDEVWRRHAIMAAMARAFVEEILSKDAGAMVVGDVVQPFVRYDEASAASSLSRQAHTGPPSSILTRICISDGISK